MSNRSIYIISLIGLTLLGVSLLFAKEQERNSWTAFNKGSWVEIKMEHQEDDNSKSMTLRKTYLGIENQLIKLQNIYTANKQTVSKFEETLPLKAEYMNGTLTGTEAISFADKSYVCEVWTYTLKKSAANVTGKTWYNTELMMTLKREESSDDSNFTSIATAVEQIITIKDTEISCILYSSTKTMPNGVVNSKTWKSNSMPGGFVKSETNATIDGKTTTQNSIVNNFKIK